MLKETDQHREDLALANWDRVEALGFIYDQWVDLFEAIPFWHPFIKRRVQRDREDAWNRYIAAIHWARAHE